VLVEYLPSRMTWSSAAAVIGRADS